MIVAMAGEDNKIDGENAGGAVRRAIPVSLSDFPVFDGSSSPEPFIQQCERLASLGDIASEQLQTIIAARCRGLALNVIEADGEQVDVTSRLRAAFGAKSSELALSRLSTAVKGDTPVLEYATFIKELVRDACSEFFDRTGKVKSICVPAHNAALYRHFLIGLSSHEKILLSRQNVSTFDAAVDALRREETLVEAFGGRNRREGQVRFEDREVMDVECSGVESSGSGDRARRSSPGDPRARRSSPSLSRYRGRDRPPPARPARRSPGPARDSPGRRLGRSGGYGGDSPRPPRRDDSPWPTRRRQSSFPPRRGGSPWTPRGGESPRPARRGGSPRAARGGSSSDSEDERPRAGPGARRASPAPPDRARREVRCWSCRGYGHLKRQCPNGY